MVNGSLIVTWDNCHPAGRAYSRQVRLTINGSVHDIAIAAVIHQFVNRWPGEGKFLALVNRSDTDVAWVHNIAITTTGIRIAPSPRQSVEDKPAMPV